MAKNTPESQEFEVDETVSETASTGDARESAETPKRPKLQPFPAAMYRLAILGALALAGECARETYLSHRNPDSRSAEEIARAVLIARGKLNGDKDAEKHVTDERVKKTVETARCIANKMGHPYGDSYTGKNKIEHKDRKDDEFTFKGKTYALLPNNTRNHEYTQRSDAFVHNLKSMKQVLPDAVEWLHISPEEVLKQPLVCARNPENGECETTLEGEVCYLNEVVAEAYNMASADMYAAGEGRIMYGDCFRGPVKGFTLFAALNGQGCSVAEKPGVMLPGNGFHGMGLATDLLNKAQAKRYLYRYGITCDFVKNDGEHCSFAEHVPNRHWYNAMEAARKLELGLKLYRKFKKK